MAKLEVEEIERLVESIGPWLGCDFTYPAVYPKNRDDIAAVRRLAENGSDYGFDTIYLVHKDNEGKIHHEELINSRSTKDYIHVDEVIAEELNNKIEVVVKVGSGGSYSGTPWKEEIPKTISL